VYRDNAVDSYDTYAVERKESAMFTSKFAANRAVLRVLLYGWHEHELPRFNFKFKSRNAGSLSDVLSKFASDIHFLIVADDAVDDSTKEILLKGYYSKPDSCFFVDGNSVKDDFGLNGHTADDNVKNIVLYGFEDPLEPEIVHIFRPVASGKLKDVLNAPNFRYSAAVVVESRPLPENEDLPTDAVIVESNAGKRLVVLDDEMSGFLKGKALYMEGQGDISYYILPYSTVRELSA
jgi:hypothetical protein